MSFGARASQAITYLGALVSLLHWSLSQAPPCAGKEKYIRCKSYAFKYKECPTGEPSPISSVSINIEYSKSKGCEYHAGPKPTEFPKGGPAIYGFENDLVWTAGKCKAQFLVCLSDECGAGSGIKCHKDATCVWGETGLPECQCNKGLYGDGVTSCSGRCKCSATGDPHFRLFDGQMVHFQGTCTYTLVDTGTGDCPFTVNVKHRRSPRNSKVALTEKMIVIVGSTTSNDTVTVEIDQGRKVTVNGVPVNGPLVTDTFRIIHKGNNVIVKNQCDMEAMFNGLTTARVFVPQEYASKSSGICGKCNGIPDDYKTKDGTDVSGHENKYSLIGKSYLVEGVAQNQPECQVDDKDIGCTDDIKQQIASNEYCGLIKDSTGPFKDCIKRLGDDYIQDAYFECEYDVCANWGSKTDEDEQVCNALAKLHGDCNEKDVTNINFRTADFCPADCRANMKYEPLITTVQPSCKNPNPSQLVDGPPVEGCICIEGFIFDDGTNECVPPEDCGCLVDDNYYPVGWSFMDSQCSVKSECVQENGKTFLKDKTTSCGTHEVCNPVSEWIGLCDCAESYIRREDGSCEELCDGIKCHENAVCVRGEGYAQCRCNKGLYGNGVTACSENCKCSATGDPHIKTYDGQMIHYQQNCTFTMVDAGNQECGMIVNVKNRRSTKNPKVSLVEKVIVIVKSTESNDTIVIDQGKKVSVNGVGYSGAVQNANFEIIQKGSYVVVENNCDMRVMFNGEATMKVFIPKHYAEVASGVCGKCDGVHNDLRIKDGTDVSDNPNRYSLIGNSYWAGGNKETAEECLKNDEQVTCSEELKQQIASNEHCGMIRDTAGPFKECIESLGIEYIDNVYYECEFDVCANWGSDTDVMEQVCNAMSKLQGDCNEEPIPYVNFKTADFCPDNCGANMVYDPAMNSVDQSCKNPSPVPVVSGAAVEGCKCKVGYLLDDGNNKCVPEGDCGCAEGDNYYQIGYNHLDEQCTVRTSCLRVNGERTFKTEAESCGTNERCDVVSAGIGKCNCVDDLVRVNGICEAVPECSVKKKIRCKSYHDQYVECPTNKDTPISKIWIDFYAPGSAECKFIPGPVPQDYPGEGGIFGFTDFYVWVHLKCRATFWTCYDVVGANGEVESTSSGTTVPPTAGANGEAKSTSSGTTVPPTAGRCKCSATGDPHFRLFDGQMVHFQGTCTYTLVDTGTGDCPFTVNVKHRRSTRNSKVALTEKMIVIVGSITSNDTVTVVIDQGRKVTVNRVPVNGPLVTDTFRIIHKGNNVIVKNQCDMEAMFNGIATARVFVPQEYASKASGICGKCNGIQDDYKTKDGTDVSGHENKYSLIGKSYLVVGVDQNQPECQVDDKDIGCTDDIKQQIASNKYCGLIKDSTGPFKDCIKRLGDDYIQDAYFECEYDVCANWGSKTDEDEQVCNALAKLHGDCNEKDVTNINFRTADFCPADCRANMKYEPLITTVQPSCKNPNPSQLVDGPPVEGCICIEGFIFDDGTNECVPSEDCGCLVDDNYYPVGWSFMDSQCSVKSECVQENGKTFLKDKTTSCGTHEVCNPVSEWIGLCDCAESYIRREDGSCEELCDGINCHENAVCVRGDGYAQCRCNKGLYGNGVTACSENCKCSATGDPHIKTFDGQMIHYQQNCTFNMVDAGNQECGVIVNVKNRRSTKNPKVSLVEKVIVIVKSTESNDTIVIDQGKKVSVNGVGYNGAVQKANFEIIQKGSYVVVENNCDMRVMFNGEATMKVFIPKHYAEVASGVCGKCDGVHNDLRIKDGTDVSDNPNKYSLVGNSYWVGGNKETAEECLKNDEQVTCSEDLKQQIASNKYCGKIRDNAGPFKDCIESLGIEYIDNVYYECEFDVCANWGSDTDVMEQVCNAMSKLQGDCNEEPIPYVNFKTVDFCPDNCGAKMVYDPAMSSVDPSCKNPNPVPVISGAAVEGCKCKAGYLLDDGNNKCVPEGDCGCAKEDNYYQIGYNHLDEQCTVRTSCLRVNGERTFKTEAESCGTNEKCDVVSAGIGKCNCVDDLVRVNGICEAVPECSVKKKIRCKSYFDQYVECHTNKDTPITKIWIDFYAPGSAECKFIPGPVPQDYPGEGGIFGFTDFYVWVHLKCRATFWTCYDVVGTTAPPENAPTTLNWA